ncbi:Tyrosine-protein phosphatase YwqE [Blautia obeum]|nr:Tyrosine-protein phosphatase YwqE [Blautia obeum]
MIDIHAHILPDLDDGSEDMEESLEMAELAVESGVEIMAATPHSNQMGRFENFQSE